MTDPDALIRLEQLAAETNRSGDAYWSDNMIQRLRELWAEGHSTIEIGRRLGVRKDSVVGKAHRLNLPARPSPIKRAEPPPPPKITRTEPLPAGHPVSWGAITRGTWLEGEGWPG